MRAYFRHKEIVNGTKIFQDSEPLENFLKKEFGNSGKMADVQKPK